MTSPRRIVIAGSSAAGVTAASTLRGEGFDGDVVVLSAERNNPYSRVPLSKEFLAGTSTSDDLLLPALADVELRLATPAIGLDLDRRRIHTTDDEIEFDRLIIATGSRARRLTRLGIRGEFTIRTMEDAADLASTAAGCRSATVVGGGFLGMELASTLSQLGLSVTLISRHQPLVSALGNWLADVLCERARRAGVGIVTANSVELRGDPVTAVQLDSNRVVEADVVVTAVGDEPETGWLAGTPLHHAEGIPVDPACRVNDVIAAAGDVAVFGQRTPYWSSAVAQGRQAALSSLGIVGPVSRDPYFWTHMFGLEVKLSGRPSRSVRPLALDGDLEDGSALFQWANPDGSHAAAAINRRMPIARLKALGAMARNGPDAP